MQWFDTVLEYLRNFSIRRASMDFSDVLEILVLAVVVYYILVWMKATRAWALLKGLIVICVFLALAYLLKMNNILWMVQRMLGIAVIALVIILQPELRRALEDLGKKNLLNSIFNFDAARKDEKALEEKTISEIIKACVEMGKARTGALIVIERQVSLREFERTGIHVDGIVSSQLLINIFEHNTPLHDGAVIIRGSRVTYATCYLPLSDNLNLGKELGTRHRAGVGISEETDSLTLIVSEETGRISIALEGRLIPNLDAEALRVHMQQALSKETEESKAKMKLRKWKGRSRAEK